MILLITGTINVDSDLAFVSLKETEERLEQYIYSIKYAIQNYEEITHVIFCENSGYNYNYDFLYDIAEKYGKSLTVLSFEGNSKMVALKGKGYGEGEIIRFALENDRILFDSQCFYKLTGRLVVENMNNVMKKTKEENAFFACNYKKNQRFVTTHFYKVNTAFYKKELMSSYMRVNDKIGFFLEHVFFDVLRGLNIKSFGVLPIINGVSGTTGNSYKGSFMKIVLNRILLKMGHFNI